MFSEQDEGYSEAPLSMAVGVPWLTDVPPEDRARLAMDIIHGLPTAMVCDIVDALRPRLYINFLQHLPAEVCLKVLGYLDPLSLLHVAQACREGLALASDGKLWQQLYFLEGWQVVDDEIRKFDAERTLRKAVAEHHAKRRAMDLEMPDVRAGKLNWQFLYAQRRRLEANWEAARYTNFQLPHPNYPHEAHEECIYTIQYSGQYLVSGSRDKTVRIWDLDTRRLVRPPLHEHRGSVLCLQFDASPEEDIIVSGSSDSNVIIWRFSTGEMLQRLKRAHKESVLNVRFDRRILATCSKDKTIKIFNRRPLAPGDVGYPVHPVPRVVHPDIISPYTMIGCLDGHNAAVNAVQIHGDEIVSASGDRNVKIWDWPTQTCTRTLMGHHKGIACVQYDGRRVVSGSSDNEVKVFDKLTGLEVASLKAHTNLVRTVQAGFGDLPNSHADDQALAKRVDNDFFRAVEAGEIDPGAARRKARNAGSHQPQDITAYGAKLPPGGGGGRYGRIVSGSYDETIIIWRRDKTGAWKAQHLLRQEDAAHAANRGSESLIDQTIPLGNIALRQLLQRYPQTAQHPHLQTAIAAEPSSAARVALRQEVLRAQQLDNRPPNMARVFKLQFDARRIICCSQTPVIVGWDFANDDDQIREASRFFAPVE